MTIPSDREVARLAALCSYAVLDSEPSLTFDRITSRLAKLLRAPVAVVSLIDERRQWFLSCQGLAMKETPRDIAICQHVMEGDAVLIVPDTARDDRFRDNPLVLESPHVRFYAGAPLRTPEGEVLGSLCVMDFKPREFSAEEAEILTDLAAIVMDELELVRSARKLEKVQAEMQEVLQGLARSEARKAAILNGALDAIITFDHTGKILEVNPATERVYGYSAEQMVGRTIAEMVVPPSGLDAHFKGLKSLFTSGDGPVLGRRRELLSKRADGSEFPIENAIHRIPGEGSPMFTVHIRDITLRKRSEAALQGAKEEAERANTAKSEFLSRMSHELRTPLNAILGFSQLMQMGQLDSKQEESLEHITNAGRHLLDLINEVLDLARIESGRTHWSPESVDVYDVLAECIALLRPQAQQRHVNIQVESTLETQDWYVVADRQRLKQIFINLLTNAVKYNRPSGSVTLRCFADSAGHIATEFIDTGVGMAEDELPRLFTPFERLGAEKSGVEGTGIGLAITQRLALLMGGKIEVTSTAGEGSTFRVLLPSTDLPPVEEIEMGADDDANISNPECRTIVYIEDNLSNIRLMERIVSTTSNLDLVTCRTGAEAVECALQHKPDIILLDLHLPGVCGADVLQQLRARSEFSETPIVIVSADAMGNQSVKLLKEGANAYVTKPIHIPSMLRTIEQLLAASKRARVPAGEEEGAGHAMEAVVEAGLVAKF